MELQSEVPITSIAFYLPQYHPIPENDEWWGPGFTEWTNVVPSRPLFPGHYQPHVPSGLGYYDLRDPQTRLAQAELARAHGIDAFCYYHYWFHGKRLLNRPFDEVLSSGQPEFPFCLCWANEPWTRTWDGNTKAILADQRYSVTDDAYHIDWLLDAFADDRYLKVDGKPIFLVYRASALPDPLRTMDSWRKRAEIVGLPGLYLCRVESREEQGDPRRLGFDASVDFLPNARNRLFRQAARRRALFRKLKLLKPESSRIFVEYEAVMREVLSQPEPRFPWFPCVTPSWDNTPRRPQAALVFTNSTPALFGEWVAEVVARLRLQPADRRLLFVNAWNEWGEGCHLEPCQRWEDGYLRAFSEGLAS